MSARKDSDGRFVSELPGSVLDEIAASVVLGTESQRALGARLGITRPAVQRALKRDDVQAIIRAERARTTEAARGRRRRAAANAEEQGSPEHIVQTLKTGKPPKERKHRSKSSADGRILGVLTFDSYGGNHRHVRSAGFEEGPSEPDEEQWRDMPREPFAPTLDACVVTPTGSYGFDPLDTLDIGRVADLVASDLPDLIVNDIRATLSQVPQGRTIQFDPEEA